MNDKTIEQVRDELRRLASDGGFGQMADVIDAHLAKAAQPVEALDIGVGRDIVKRLRDTPNWLKEAWGDFKSAGANKYDRAPKEAADYIETLLAALAHPRPTGDAAPMLADALADITATRLDDEEGSETYDCDGHARCVEIADAALTRYESAIGAAPMACACGAECMDTGHGNCRYAAPTGEQAGKEV